MLSFFLFFRLNRLSLLNLRVFGLRFCSLLLFCDQPLMFLISRASASWHHLFFYKTEANSRAAPTGGGACIGLFLSLFLGSLLRLRFSLLPLLFEIRIAASCRCCHIFFYKTEANSSAAPTSSAYIFFFLSFLLCFALLSFS